MSTDLKDLTAMFLAMGWKLGLENADKFANDFARGVIEAARAIAREEIAAASGTRPLAFGAPPTRGAAHGDTAGQGAGDLREEIAASGGGEEASKCLHDGDWEDRAGTFVCEMCGAHLGDKDAELAPTPVAPETGGLVRWDARIKPDEDWTPYAAAQATIADLKRERDRGRDILADTDIGSLPHDHTLELTARARMNQLRQTEADLAALRERVGEAIQALKHRCWPEDIEEALALLTGAGDKEPLIETKDGGG